MFNSSMAASAKASAGDASIGEAFAEKIVDRNRTWQRSSSELSGNITLYITMGIGVIDGN